MGSTSDHNATSHTRGSIGPTPPSLSDTVQEAAPSGETPRYQGEYLNSLSRIYDCFKAASSAVQGLSQTDFESQCAGTIRDFQQYRTSSETPYPDNTINIQTTDDGYTDVKVEDWDEQGIVLMLIEGAHDPNRDPQTLAQAAIGAAYLDSIASSPDNDKEVTV